MPRNPRFDSTLYNRDYLHQRYVVDGLDGSQLAREIGCTPSAVGDALRRFDIPVKSMSEIVKKLPHAGSHAPRKKTVNVERFKDTLHNDDWVRARIGEGCNASEIARLSGASVPTVQHHIRRLGLTPPTISEAKAGRPALDKRLKDGETMSRVSSHRLANSVCPPGPCVICGGKGDHVNHMSRNWQDNRAENLERLCRVCHVWQHKAETFLMLKEYQDANQFERIRQEARDAILSGDWVPAPNRTPGSLTYEGQTLTLSEWAEKIGIRVDLIRSRLAAGWDVKDVLNTPVREKPSTFLFEGVWGNVADHARRKGIPVGNVYSRLYQGWDRERALSTPIRPHEDDGVTEPE